MSTMNILQPNITVSPYYLDLDTEHQERYLAKLVQIGVDPYCVDVDKCSSDVEQFPKIMYPDIVNYLLYTKSAYTFEELKAYKSLEAYNQVACGWVKKVVIQGVAENVLVLGKVLHSQRLSERLLSPWVFAKNDVEVLSAHCDCVAGRGEYCTHVAALLFAVDDSLKKVKATTTPGSRAYWVAPSSKSSEPCKVAEIDLLPTKKRKQLDLENDAPLLQCDKFQQTIPSLTDVEIGNLLHNISRNTSGGSVL